MIKCSVCKEWFIDSDGLGFVDYDNNMCHDCIVKANTRDWNELIKELAREELMKQKKLAHYKESGP